MFGANIVGGIQVAWNQIASVAVYVTMPNLRVL
jgi:hypothetical protein